MMPVTEQVRAAIRGAGLHPLEVIESDGELHRFASSGNHVAEVMQ